MKAPFSLADVDSLKAELTRLLPTVKSSHRVEAMARGLGWGSNAALRAELAKGPLIRIADCREFTGYLKDHGFPDTPYDTLQEAVVRCKYPDQRAAIEDVMAKEPGLSRNGFYTVDLRTPREKREADFEQSRRSMTEAHAVDEFMRACEYLAQVERRKTVNRSCTSYSWKHVAERFHRDQGAEDPYVSNGMFLAAAIHMGFIVKSDGANSPNAYLNIASEKEPRRSPSSMLAGNVGGKTRITAWRNMMVAAINAGLDQGLFGLAVDDNRWPGFKADVRGRGVTHVYRFTFSGLPAIASVRDGGFGELAIHVSVNPTKRGGEFVRTVNGGLYAGDAFAAGRLERENGKWLQRTKTPTNAFRRAILPVIAAVEVEPKGYQDTGPLMM